MLGAGCWELGFRRWGLGRKQIENPKSEIENPDDWLGTERVRTNSSGAVCETISSLPFGDGQTISGSCGDPSPNHFTGKERDNESGLDNFGARHNASGAGRFLQADSGPFTWADPQTLNRYAYTRNNPLKFVDPTGKYFVISPTDPHYAQLQVAIADMLLSPRGRVVVEQIARDPRPSFFGSGFLPPTPLKGKPGVTNVEGGRTHGIMEYSTDAAGKRAAEPDEPVKGTVTIIDFSNLPAMHGTSPQVDLQGIDTTVHEMYHVASELVNPTWGASTEAGLAGDKPTSMGGAAEAFAQAVKADAQQTISMSGDQIEAMARAMAAFGEASSLLQQGQQQFLAAVSSIGVSLF